MKAVKIVALRRSVFTSLNEMIFDTCFTILFLGYLAGTKALVV